MQVQKVICERIFFSSRAASQQSNSTISSFDYVWIEKSKVSSSANEIESQGIHTEISFEINWIAESVDSIDEKVQSNGRSKRNEDVRLIVGERAHVYEYEQYPKEKSHKATKSDRKHLENVMN